MIFQTTIPTNRWPAPHDVTLFVMLELVAFRTALAHGLPLTVFDHMGGPEAAMSRVCLDTGRVSIFIRTVGAGGWSAGRRRLYDILTMLGSDLALLRESKGAALDAEDEIRTPEGFRANVTITVRKLYKALRQSIPCEDHHHEKPEQIAHLL